MAVALATATEANNDHSIEMGELEAMSLGGHSGCHAHSTHILKFDISI